MVNIQHSLSAFASTLNLDEDPRIVQHALQLYTQASARTGTNSATPLVCLELACEKFNTALDRRLATRLAGVTITIYKNELMRLHDLLGIPSSMSRVTLKSLVVQFGSISMLSRCEQVMTAFKEKWSAALPGAQLSAVQWERPVFPVGVFLACCKVAAIRVDRAKLRLISGERAQEINKVVALTEYYAPEELKTLNLPMGHIRPSSARIRKLAATQMATIGEKSSTEIAPPEPTAKPTKRTRKTSAQQSSQSSIESNEKTDTKPTKNKRKRSTKEVDEIATHEIEPIDDNGIVGEVETDKDEATTTKPTKRRTRKIDPDSTTQEDKKEASKTKTTRQRRKTITDTESAKKEESTTTAASNATLDNNNTERNMQLREPPVDGINPMISPIPWKDSRQFINSITWKEKMFEKLRLSNTKSPSSITSGGE
ncbi:hypothetical protein BDF19DRAFT_453253 [Syncephalis fuscata]|nr:hypothetical protein BDF19DRAFT_453253 [Syncephalis fuscata]